MDQSVQIAAFLVQLEESFIGQVFLVRRLGSKNHPEAGAEPVFAQVGELQLERLQIEGISNVIQIDFRQKLVPLQRTKPLNPADQAWVVRVLGKCAVFLEFFVRF